MKHKRGLILFAKSPSPGKVKTRLEPVLDTETILALYKQLLVRQISLVNRCDLTGISESAWELRSRARLSIAIQ
jgi:glycosyltransferase A (GT-A) superfamily protein (DUF2064 family)